MIFLAVVFLRYLALLPFSCLPVKGRNVQLPLCGLYDAQELQDSRSLVLSLPGAKVGHV